MGNVHWTPELQRLLANIKIWSLVLKRRRGGRVNSKYLRRLSTRHNLDHARSASLAEAVAGRKEAMAAFKQYKKTSREKRDTWLDGLAQARVAAGKDKADSVHKNLKELKRVCCDNRIIKQVTGSTAAKESIHLLSDHA